MERINMKTIPASRMSSIANVSFTSNSTNVRFNAAAVKLLALRKGDRVGFDWDGRKLYLIVPDPDGFVVHDYSTGFSLSSTQLRAKVEKLTGKKNPRFEIEEFKEGRWPLKII